MDSGAASCSTGSSGALQSLVKHTLQDRSLHQEGQSDHYRRSATGPQGPVGAARRAFRAPPPSSAGPRETTIHAPFHMADLGAALEAEQEDSGWEGEFVKGVWRGGPRGVTTDPRGQRAMMEEAFSRATRYPPLPSQAHPLHHPPTSPQQQQQGKEEVQRGLMGWAEEFSQSSTTLPSGSVEAWKGKEVEETWALDFDSAFAAAEASTLDQTVTKDWEGKWDSLKDEVGGKEEEGSTEWADSFTRAQEEQMTEEMEEAWAEGGKGTAATGDLASTAAALTRVMEETGDPRFAQSQFAELMRQFRDGQAAIEGNRVVNVIQPVGGLSQVGEWMKEFTQAKEREESEWAREYGGARGEEESSRIGKSWVENFEKGMMGSAADQKFTQPLGHPPGADMLQNAYSNQVNAGMHKNTSTFPHKAEAFEAEDELHDAWSRHTERDSDNLESQDHGQTEESREQEGETEGDMGSHVDHSSDPQPSVSSPQSTVQESGETYRDPFAMAAFEESFRRNMALLGNDQTKGTQEEVKPWRMARLREGDYPATDAGYDDYQFLPGTNPFLVDPTRGTMATPASFSSSSSSTHSKLHQGAQGRGGRESAEEERLDLEARVLKARETGRVEPSLVETWTRLGLLAQEAGDDRQAIAAFRQAVGIGYVDAPVQQRTWIALASSLINEGCRTEAYDALLSAISSQEVPIPPGKEEGSSWHYEVVEAYLSRIRLTAGPEGRGIDPSLQEGLSLAFTLSSQWDRAVECLETALSVRPEDPVLWNRLGVALGQAKAYPEAKEAYARALDLNPRYQRARDNLNALSGT